MQGFNIRDMLRKASSNPEVSIDRLPAQLSTIIQKYQSDRDILPAFKSDIYRFLTAAANLAEAMADKTFVSQVVINHAYDIFTACSAFMLQAERTRVTKPAFGIQHRQTKAILPQIFATEAEAEAYINDHAPFGNISEITEIIPIEIVSRYGRQPSRVGANAQLPQPPLEVEISDEADFEEIPPPISPGVVIPTRATEAPTPAALENAARKEELQRQIDEAAQKIAGVGPGPQQAAEMPTPSFRRE